MVSQIRREIDAMRADTSHEGQIKLAGYVLFEAIDAVWEKVEEEADRELAAEAEEVRAVVHGATRAGRKRKRPSSSGSAEAAAQPAPKRVATRASQRTRTPTVKGAALQKPDQSCAPVVPTNKRTGLTAPAPSLKRKADEEVCLSSCVFRCCQIHRTNSFV